MVNQRDRKASPRRRPAAAGPRPQRLAECRKLVEAFRAAKPRSGGSQDVDRALNLLVEMMAEAGLDPAAIYAFKRTGGLFPTGKLPLTAEELAEWNQALAEYHQKFQESPIQ